MLRCYQCKSEALYREPASGRLFCGSLHREIYNSGWASLSQKFNTDPVLRKYVLLQLGANGEDEDDEGKEEEIDFTLIEFLPNETLEEILKFAFRDFGISEKSTREALNARQTSARMQLLIDTFVLGSVTTLFVDDGITDAIMPLFIRLKTLSLGEQSQVTNEGLRSLTRLEKLMLIKNTKITDADLSVLTQLKSLDLTENDVIDGDSFWDLGNLESLVLARNKKVHSGNLIPLNSLRMVNLDGNDLIRGALLLLRSNLEELSLDMNFKVTADELKQLTQLKALIIPQVNLATDQALVNLTQLTYLDLWDNKRISNAALDTFRGSSTLIILSPFDRDRFDPLNLNIIVTPEHDKETMKKLTEQRGLNLRYYQ